MVPLQLLTAVLILILMEMEFGIVPFKIREGTNLHQLSPHKLCNNVESLTPAYYLSSALYDDIYSALVWNLTYGRIS